MAMMMMMMMIRYYPSTIIIIGLLSFSYLIVNINAQSTCNINGITYNVGETVSQLGTDDPNENRCGPSYECVCNPTAFQQLDCPFCSFATNIPNLLRCANDGEIVEFRDTNNIGQICSCDASNPSNPISSCTQSSTAGLTCDITIPQDGRTITYNDGDIVGIESICGATSDFPCYCNPNLPTQIECPYCMISNPFAGTVCAEVGTTVNVIDSQGIDVQACTCEDSYSLAFPKLFNCNAAPTFAPIEPGAQCTNLIDETTNETFTVDHGTNLGSRITSEFCGPPSEYPCYCDVRLPNQVDCPYCAADDGDGGYICGVHNEVLENVPQTDGTTTRDCLCLKPTPGSDPEIVCGDFTLAPTEAPVECVIDDQSFEPGQSIPTSVVPADGPCGSGFQYVCNPDLDDDGTTNNLEYPYCEHTTNTGSTVCARNGQSVTFTNESNDDVTCDCSYTTSGGPNPTCGPKATTSPTISVAPSQSPSVPPPTPNVNTAGNSGATKTTTTTTFMIGYVIMMGWIFVLL